MKLTLFFAGEAKAENSSLPELKSPQEFSYLPGKGETIRVATVSGKKISVIVTGKHGYRTGVAMSVIPTNGVGKH